MNIPVFELERVQSLYENTVDFNLTESGFHPLTINELLSKDEINELNNLLLGYGQTNGSIPLRRNIATLYEDCDESNILVTNGSSEANFIACHTILEKDDEVIMMVPNYMQIWGIAKEMGCVTKKWHLLEKNNWAPDMDELHALISPRTKMIVICNPDNPTGYTLTSEEMQEIIKIAESNGVWIYSDEIYRGAELNGVMTDSFFGNYDKVLVNGGLSKAYALPGIRIGWLTGPKELIENAWAYHDYTSICAGIISNRIAEIALREENRAFIFHRNRSMLNENLSVVGDWLNQYGGLFKYIPPKAGGMLFVRYNLGINSSELSEWLRKEKSVFIPAGDCFGMDSFFRIGIGERKEYILNGLDRIKEALNERFSI